MAGTVMVLAIVVSTAGPAAAHPGLLRTAPPPQPPAKTPPAGGRRGFPEAVGGAFGPGRGFPAAERFRRRFQRALPWAWGVLAVAWLATLVFQAASISGLGLWQSAKPGVLADVLRTGSGHSWVAGLGFTLLCGLPVAGLTRPQGLFGARPQTW